MRWAALLHDAAKPQTRAFLPNGRVTFLGHDTQGAQLAKDVLGRMRSSSKLREYVAALAAHHLDAGFLVHQRPLDRRTIWRYLRATRPYSVDVTVFTVADRLATRGRNAQRAIAAHLEVAQRAHPGSARADPAAARPRRRADSRSRREGRPEPRRDPRPARGGPLRRRALHARGSTETSSGAEPTVIEFATPDDAADVERIVNAAYDAGEVGIWREGWKRIARESVEALIDRQEIAVARQDGSIIGSVRVLRLDENTAELGMLSVAPEAFGTGTGKALLTFAEQVYDTDFMQLELLVPRSASAPEQGAAARVVQPPRLSGDLAAGLRRAAARRPRRPSDLSQEPPGGACDLSARAGADVHGEQHGGDAELTG